MGCIERGKLRAFLDLELTEVERAGIESHLAECVLCRMVLDELRENTLVVRSALDMLTPAVSDVPAPHWSEIRGRAKDLGRRPVTTYWGLSAMFGNLLSFVVQRRMKWLASTAAVLIVVALLFTVTPMQTLASNFLSIFRVQKFVAVQVDPSTLPKVASPDELGTYKMTGDGKPKTVAIGEVEGQTGLKMPLPAYLPEGLVANPRVTVFGAQSITFTPDLKKVRSYLASIGAPNVKLPDNLDGAPISIQIPARAILLYLEAGGYSRSADGAPAPLPGQKFLYLGATQSPTMNVPDGLDVEKIRSELLMLPSLSPELVNQLKSINDWRTTMVVPVAKGTSREVTVQGEKGLAIGQEDGKWFSVMWVKGGVIYALSGNFSLDEILKVANSMR